MESAALTQIDEFQLTVLRELLSQCTEAQRALFGKMYDQFGGLENIPKEKLDWAILQCERTVEANKAKPVTQDATARKGATQ